MAATSTSVMYPIVTALVAAEAELGPNRDWKPINDKQRRFLSNIFAPSREEATKIPEIESTSSRNHEVINEFLRSRGFSIKLDPFQSPSDFGVASVLKLALEWLEKGTKTQITAQGQGTQLYPAVHMEGGVQFFTAQGHEHQVVKLLTKSGDEVYLTMMDKPVPQDDLDITALRLLCNLSPNRQHSKVVFPMVDLDQQPDISWLVEMWTPTNVPNEFGIVKQALQQTKFAMDEVGAKVESAVAIGMVRSVSRVAPPYRIDKPFLAVVTRPTLKQPIFVGYLDTDCWKKPVR